MVVINAFFRRKFAVTSVMSIFTKIYNLQVYSDYDHMYIPLTSD